MTLRTLVPIIVLALLGHDLARAQGTLAPTGPHHAGRASDTGSSAVTPVGGYHTSVALDLPAVRGGLQVPLSIVYGGRRIGAAGLGWDVPLSFVHFSTSIAHRRPKFQRTPGSTAAYEGREQLTVSIAGLRHDMTRAGHRNSDGEWVWVAREDAMALEIARTTTGWLLRDGDGRQYRFEQSVKTATQELWLLTSVASPTGAMRLVYEVTALTEFGPNVGSLGGQPTGDPNTIPPWGAGRSIDLVRVLYNSHPHVSGCFKNEIELVYGTGGSTRRAVSISMMDELPIVRTRYLSLVNVLAREACGSPVAKLRSYDLEYIVDPDTQNRRLRSVWRTGRTGTLEENERLPVAVYDYGVATQNTYWLPHREGSTIAVPDIAKHNPNGTPGLTPMAVSTSTSEESYVQRDLIDMTGDGRPDLVFPRNGKLWIAINRPGIGDASTVFDPPVVLNDSVFTGSALWMSTHYVESWYSQGHGGRNFRTRRETWLRPLDVNGDGRMDIVSAGEKMSYWVIYLNTPGSPVTWKRREMSNANLAAALRASGHNLADNHIYGDRYVPLARESTGTDTRLDECWLWDGSKWIDRTPHVGSIQCPSGDTPDQKVDGNEKTFVEWDVADINGDRYPDLVFGESPVVHVASDALGAPVLDTTPFPGGYRHPKRRIFRQRTHGLRAVINVAGVRIAQANANLFSDPVSLQEPFIRSSSSNAGPNQQDSCSVAKWEDNGTGTQTRHCAVADVNGDGIADRIHGRDVTLGTGTSFASGVRMTLPGMVRAHNPRKEVCKSDPSGWYTIDRGSGLHDLTGDGIPDFVDDGGYVHIGTGVGFRAHVLTTLGQISVGVEVCQDTQQSYTHQGLYDLDGDGKPEFVSASGHTWTVRHIDGSRLGNPDAGLLTNIDNGYGAQTTIKHRSAKQDVHSTHLVPFPEIVVDSVKTTGIHGLGGTLAEVRYAYGHAEQFFDPIRDAFTMRRYGRTVEVHGTAAEGRLSAFAVLRDAHGLSNFDPTADATERFARYQRVGRIKDTFVITANVPRDPWEMLDDDPVNTFDIMDVDQSAHASRLVPANGNVIPHDRWDCQDIVDPYDWDASITEQNATYLGACNARGFSYEKSSRSWTGVAIATMRIETRTDILEIDDLGRARRVRQYNDTARSDDDLCIETTYATPISLFVRLHFLPATRRVTSCGTGRPRNLTFEYWEYNQLPVGLVSLGQLSAHVTESFATDTGQSQGVVREFEASHDNVGNATYMVSAREDGATRAIDIVYDDFRLAPRKIAIDAAATPTFTTELRLDPLTLDTLEEQAPSGVRWVRTLDGHGRETQLAVKAPSGSGVADGVVSTTSYIGFAEGAVGGRSITTTSRTASNSVTGRSDVTYLDELGRAWRNTTALGEDYDNRELVVMRRWDDLGRLHFESDAFPSTQDANTAYGTTYHFDREGALRCSIRGRGVQPLVEATNLAQEVLPTCYSRVFDNHRLQVSVRSPDSNAAGTSQAGVVRRETMTAIGRVLQRETLHNTQVVERSTHEHDALGHLKALHRYRTPSTSQDPVTWRWRYDSTGRVLSAMEPDAATRTMTYNNWDDLVLTEWTDTTGAAPVEVELRREFDAHGRLVFSVDARSGQEVAGTAFRYRYDTNDGSSPIASGYSIGRITMTASDLGNVHVGYDAFGRVSERAFVAADGAKYFESTRFNFDGTPSLVEHRLPDTGYSPEQYRYRFDSAQRLRSVERAQDNTALYVASSIDDFGRVRKAVYGKDGEVLVNNEYADEGRRMPTWSGVDVRGRSHAIEYVAFDAVGRELARREHEGGTLVRTISSSFDSTGRLGYLTNQPPGVSYEAHRPNYDALGNIVDLTSTTPSLDVKMTYGTQDRDRICRIGYASSAGAGPCNVLHDGVGNIVEYPTRTSGVRQLSFYPSGAVEKIRDQEAEATFRYDGSGEISEINVIGDTEKRRDLRFGPFVRRTSGGDEYLVRDVPGDDGIVASRRGKDGPWVFPFAEMRGTRVSATDAGELVQTVEYRPFGEATSKGAEPNKPEYTSDQWNGGDLLADMGLVQLGARIYDPVIGRFLSRDPVVMPRTAATTNPYAFAWNDPMNHSDPSGLDCENPTGPCDSDWSWVPGAVAEALDRLGSLFGSDEPPSPKLVQPGTSARDWVVYVDDVRFERQAMGYLNGCFGSPCARVVAMGKWMSGQVLVSRGYLRGTANGIKGTVHAVTHPIETADSLLTAIMNPGVTLQAIGERYMRATSGLEAWGEFWGEATGSTAASLGLGTVLKWSLTPRPLRATGRVTTRINLARGRTRTTPLRATNQPISAGWDHVVEGHFNRPIGPNRSVFSLTPAEVRTILQSPAVVRSPVTPIPGGQFVRTVNVGRVVGYSTTNRGGRLTTYVRVYTDEAGNLITAYPH